MSTAEMNPYHSGNYEPAKSVGPAKRPTGLLVFCVIVIVFASMGLLGNIVTLGSYVVSGGAANYEGQFGKESPIDWNPEVLKKLTALGPTHSMRNIVVLVASFVIDLFALVTAVGAIMGKKWGYVGFTIAAALSIGLALGQAAAAQMSGGEINRIVAEQREQEDGEIIVAKDDKDAQVAEFTSGVMAFTFGIIPIFMWIWGGIKAIFYASIVLYLRKSNVRAFFQGAATT